MRLSASLMGMWTHAEHGVEPDQYEPNIAEEDQAHEHILDFGIYAMRIRGEYVAFDGLAFALQAPVHYTIVDAHFHGEDGQELESFESIHHRKETLTGVGDLDLSTRWQALAPSADLPLTLEIFVGVSLPTGGTEPDPFVLGKARLTHQHVFFGTGTFDPLFGAELRYGGSGWASRLWTGSRLSLYANEHDYTGPGVTEGGLGFMSGFGLDSLSFLVEAGFLHEAPAKWSGVAAKNSGRTEIMANLGATWRLSPTWSISTLVKRPLYTEVLGGQMEMPLLAVLSVTYRSSAPPQ